jgi:hypothetical protein
MQYCQPWEQWLDSNLFVTLPSLFAPVMMVQMQVDTTEVRHVYGWQDHHGVVCKALGIERSWYEAPQRDTKFLKEVRTPLNVGLSQILPK